MKLQLILLSAIVSTMANVNLKITAPHLPTSIEQAKQYGLMATLLLLFRAGFFSGASLLTTWFCYKRFGLLEFIVAQSIVYVFIIIVSYFLFHEPISMNRVGAVLLILGGIGLFYAQ